MEVLQDSLDQMEQTAANPDVKSEDPTSAEVVAFRNDMAISKGLLDRFFKICDDNKINIFAMACTVRQLAQAIKNTQAEAWQLSGELEALINKQSKIAGDPRFQKKLDAIAIKRGKVLKDMVQKKKLIF